MSTKPKKPRGPTVVMRVLEVTLQELGRVGLARLSLPRVAQLAGINKTSLYRRWPTKQALVAAALSLAAPQGDELPNHGNLEDDLLDLVARLAAFMSSPAGMGALRTVFADGDTPLARQLRTTSLGRSLPRALRLVLKRAVERGELREDAEVDLLLFTMAGALLHRIFVERKAADRRWARRLIRLLSEGATPRVRRRDEALHKHP